MKPLATMCLIVGVLAGGGDETQRILNEIKSVKEEVKALRREVAELRHLADRVYKFSGIDKAIREKEQQEQEDARLALETVGELVDESVTSIGQFSPSDDSFAMISREDGVAQESSVAIYDVRANFSYRLRRPGEDAVSLAYSQDGKRLLVGSSQGRLLVWDLESKTCRVAWERPGCAIDRVAWLGNTNRAVWGTSVDHKERKNKPTGGVVDLATGQSLSTFSSFIRDDFQTLAASSNGKYLGVLEVPDRPRAGFLLNAADGQVAATLFHPKYPSGPLSIGLSPDNETVAIGYGPYHVSVWNGPRQELLRLIQAHTNWVVALAFSPDGKRLISGAGDSTARVWDLETGAEIGRIRFAGPSTYVESVGFSADGRLVFAAADGRVVVARAP